VPPLPLTAAIPTFGREQVLLNTLQMLLEQDPPAAEILVLDQSAEHEQATESQLSAWEAAGQIRWIRLSKPSQPAALNHALRIATQEFVLFLDDDIRVREGFLASHMDGFCADEIWVVAGQVLQPGEEPNPDFSYHPSSPGGLSDVDFPFNSARPALIQNAMSGNMTVRRDRALELGGFDETFAPPVSFRFDNEFSKRVCKAGGRISFCPEARIYHLRALRGGTRSVGNHLTSASPVHGFGDYYFAFLHGRGTEPWTYSGYRLYREVRTRFHLTHPWWIPVKMLGELRAMWAGWRLAGKKKRLAAWSQK
jgi:GT2 family glycosyltransferase